MPTVRCTTVALENKPGTLAAAARTLAKENVNIEAVECEAVNEIGYARFYTSNPDKSLKALEKAGFTVTTTELLEVTLANRPGELARICEALGKSGVNIESLFGSATGTGEGRLLLRVDDVVTAQRIAEETTGRTTTIAR